MKFIFFLPVINAWNFETHFLIARIAFDILEEQNPDALN
jgi:hypothetical protein